MKFWAIFACVFALACIEDSDDGGTGGEGGAIQMPRPDGESCAVAADCQSGVCWFDGCACIDGLCGDGPCPEVGGVCRAFAALGELCESGGDCASGICVSAPGSDAYCSEECIDECPDGFTCTSVGRASVCVRNADE